MDNVIKSVAKALRLLEDLSIANGPMRLRDIAQQADITRSNAFHLLQTLQDLGYVRQCDNSTQYELTLKVFEIGARVISRNSLISIAHPILVDLSEKVPDNILLSVRDGIWSVVVDRIQSRTFVRTFAHLGARAPLHVVSGGKLLLAYAPEDVVAAACANLTRITDRTITDPKKLQGEISLIRKRGYALAIGEVNDVVKGVAVPVHSRHGDVAAALSISGPMDRLGPDKVETYVGLLRAHAAKIETAWFGDYDGVSGPAKVPRPSSA